MIVPTNGRVVWFTPAAHDTLHSSYGDKPWAAHVCHVWHERMVNLLVIQPDGQTRIETSVALLQDDDPRPDAGRYAEWMPYQNGQAAKAEALEKQSA